MELARELQQRAQTREAPDASDELNLNVRLRMWRAPTVKNEGIKSNEDDESSRDGRKMPVGKGKGRMRRDPSVTRDRLDSSV